MIIDDIYTNEYHKKPFLERYPLFSKLLVIFVFTDFLLRRVALSSGILIFNNTVNILINVNYFIIFSVLFAIVFYRFYNKFFYKDIFTAVIGCSTLVISTVLIFINPNGYVFKILSIIFLIFLIIIFHKTIMPKINRTDIKESERFLFIFILIYLLASSIRFLSASMSHIIFKIFLNMYFLYDIHAYFIKLSSYSFIVFCFIYFYKFFKTINKKRIIATLLSVIILSAIFLSLRNNLNALFIYSLEALKIEIMLSSYIHAVFIMLILISSFSSAIYINRNSIMTSLLLLTLAGINITDLFSLMIILFVLTDINS